MTAMRSGIALLLLLAMVGITACGSDETADGQWNPVEPGEDVGTDAAAPDVVDEPDTAPPFELPPRIVAVDTVFTTPNPITAGEQVEVACHFFDEDGERIEVGELPETGLVYSPRASFRVNAREIFAERAGEATFACTVPSLGLIDPEPALLVIHPGPLHTLTTTLDRHIMTAGEQVTASCAGYDAFGNAVEDIEPSLRSDIGGAGILIEGLQATITRADIYTLSCHVDGVTHVSSENLEVRPDLPAELFIAAVPDETVYAVGQVISIAHVVTDQYGNHVLDARVEVTSAPEGESFGDGRFRYTEEGIYTLTATVTSPTLEDRVLTAELTIVVNSSGPEINCVAPLDAAMVNQRPGQNMTFTGRASDANGVVSVTINGAPVNVGDDGTFSTIIRPRFGINFIDVVARDAFGEENVRTCTFLASETWHDPGANLQDAVNLRLAQSAFDDGSAAGPINSLNDILRIVLNSSGLHQALHEALVASNPLKPSSCDENVCVPLLGCTCVLRSEVIYLNSSINGPNASSLTLVSDGLRLFARIENLAIRVRVRGQVSGIPYDTNLWAYFDWAEVDITSNLALSNGAPRITLRQVNRVAVSTVRISGSGLDGAIISLVASLFNGTVRNLVQNALRNYVEGEFNAILDGVVSNLDVSALGSTFTVPRLDGNGVVNLGFNVGFSNLSVTPTRAFFGLATGFSSPQTHGIPTRGVAYPTGAVRLEPSTTKNIAASVHVGVLNHALHQLWRGGFLHADVGSLIFGDELPEGALASIETRLPPLAVLSNGGRVDLHLGAMGIALAYPGLFDDPIVLNVGATARTEVDLAGDALRFNSIVIDEFHFSTDSVTLNTESRDILEGFLRNLIQQIVDQALNNALPALPIPAFALPASLTTFGLPAGAELGLTEPELRNTTRHFILDGVFGLR